jgi:UDPglucose--hexose-1-phosphate uridylyltransferase
VNELRKDILLGRWIEVLSESKAPSEYSVPEDQNPGTGCIFCPEGEHALQEIAAIRVDGRWQVRAVPDLSPLFQIEGELGRKGAGIYDRMNSIGADEIIIESPDHNARPWEAAEQVIRIISLYKSRMSDLSRDSRLRYILIHKDSGSRASYSHPVSRITAIPVIPKKVKDELDGAKQYFAYKERCIFCDIINEELTVGERVVFETRHFIAFIPYAPQFPFETWIMPKRHSCAFHEIDYPETEDIGVMLMTALSKLCSLFGDLPFSYFIHTAPNMIPRRNHWHTLGEDYHWHIEIIPRLTLAGSFELGSGFYILPTAPERAAKYLREVR